MRVCLPALSLLLWLAVSAQASQTEVHNVEGPGALLEGDFEGASVSGDGVVKAGPDQKVVVEGIAGAVLALVRAGDGQLYIATAAPGRVLKVDGSTAEDVFVSDKPLVTALLAMGKDKLVALTAPDGGAEVIELSTKKRTSISAVGVTLLLGGVVIDDVVYAVGGTDDSGMVLKLMPGASAFEIVATTEQTLRSVAAIKQGGKHRLVAGSSDEGIVYDIDPSLPVGKNVRALLDATPGEVTALTIAADGTVFAALIDSDAKLSKEASSKAKDEPAEDEKVSKPANKARKVKGGEVWRLGSNGSARVIFSSKEHGPYALGLQGARLLVGTGPHGRIVDVDGSGTGRPGVLTRKSGHDEVTALLVEKAGVLVGTSHTGGVILLGTGSMAKAAYLSKTLDAEARARFGLARVRVTKGKARVALRTGNTNAPDDTWSTWSAWAPASMTGALLAAPYATYAQLKVDLPADTEVSGLHLAYLVDNRAPEIVSIDVLAPGWKLVATAREPPETRSVTFNEKPFAKFLDRSGAQNPTLDERPYGKQSFDVGYRSVYAFVEDADKDALRYRFWLGAVGKDATVTSWSLLQDWSDAPFAAFEASRLQDGDYRVKIDVDDSPTNGSTRALADGRMSPPFVVSHQTPRASDASAARTKVGVRVKLKVDAALPLVSVRCSTALAQWLPLDPVDGILDSKSESFDVELPATTNATAASCELYDEALNFGRLDIAVP